MESIPASHAVGAIHEPPALKGNKFSIRKCRFQDSVDEIEDALHLGGCDVDGFTEKETDHVAPTADFEDDEVPSFEEQVAPTYHEEGIQSSRKRSACDDLCADEEEGEALTNKAARVDAIYDIAFIEDVPTYEENEEAHLRACCRVLDLVHTGPRPGLHSHFVCQHGGFAPGTTCDECVQEAEQRAIAAFSGRFDFGHEFNGQMAVVWTNTATGATHVDLVTISCHESVQTSVDVCYGGDRFGLRNVAFNTKVFWSAVFLFLETGSSGHAQLDELLDTAYSAARDEE